MMQFLFRTLKFSFTLWLGCASVIAAAAPPSGPPNVIDLGDVQALATITSNNIPVTPGSTVWFRFRLLHAISSLNNWMDIDTARSTIDTEMCLYDERANKVIEDGDSGGRGPSTSYNTASALTFGSGSGRRLGADGPGWFGARISTGWNASTGSVWPTLNPGVYYVAVVGYNADFSQDPNPNWQVSTNSNASGTIRLRLATGPTPGTYWNEAYRGVDAGDQLGDSQVIEGVGPLTDVVTAYSVNGRDMFKINICDPEHFAATVTPTRPYETGMDHARVFIFDSDGRGVCAINNTLNNTTTVLNLPPGTAPGDYYIAVNNYCGSSYGDPTAFSLGGAIWDFSSSGSWNKMLLPNGPGAGSPLDHWGRLSASCENSTDPYITLISLSGACHVQTDCPADFDNSGFVDTDDFTAFIEAFEVGC